MQEFRPDPIVTDENNHPRPSLIQKFFLAKDVMEMQRKLIASREEERQRGMKLEKEFAKIGRNDACPCGSGKKFKFCHLPLI